MERRTVFRVRSFRHGSDRSLVRIRLAGPCVIRNVLLRVHRRLRQDLPYCGCRYANGADGRALSANYVPCFLTEQRAKEAYTATCAQIAAHRARSNTSYTLAINSFADETELQLKQRLGFNKPLSRETRSSQLRVANRTMSLLPLHSLPASVDWRQKNVLTAVKNQGGPLRYRRSRQGLPTLPCPAHGCEECSRGWGRALWELLGFWLHRNHRVPRRHQHGPLEGSVAAAAGALRASKSLTACIIVSLAVVRSGMVCHMVRRSRALRILCTVVAWAAAWGRSPKRRSTTCRSTAWPRLVRTRLSLRLRVWAFGCTEANGLEDAAPAGVDVPV